MAMNVIKYDGKFKEFFLKLRAKGKSFKSALIAVANKFFRNIYSKIIHCFFIFSKLLIVKYTLNYTYKKT